MLMREKDLTSTDDQLIIARKCIHNSLKLVNVNAICVVFGVQREQYTKIPRGRFNINLQRMRGGSIALFSLVVKIVEMNIANRMQKDNMNSTCPIRMTIALIKK